MARPKTQGGREAPARSPLASKIADKWGSSGDQIELDRLASELGDVQRYDLVAALKELEKAGAGEFLVGRAGKKARFVWAAKRGKRAAKVAPSSTTPKGAAPRSPQGPVAAPSRAARAVVAPRVTAPKSIDRKPSAQARERVGGSGVALEHVFHLRPGFQAAVRLPSDVSADEMERFCQFLRAIPFARG